MPSKCPVCGEVAVITDQDGDMVVKVCIECGSVVDDSTLTSDPTFTQTTTHSTLGELASKVRSSMLEKDTKTRNEYHAVVRTFARQNQLNYDMEKAAMDLFDQVYETNEVRYSHVCTKHAFCHATVYIALRQCDFPVTLKDYCIRNRVDHPPVAQAYKVVMKNTGINLPFQSTANLAAGLLQTIGMDRHIVEDAVQVINLCSKVWLETGQHRNILVYAAGYFAWTASRPENYSVTWTDFCRRHKISTTRSSRLLTSLRSTLTELTDQLPWIFHGKLKRNYLATNLKDVLKYHRSLISSVKKADTSAHSNISAGTSSENVQTPLPSNKTSYCPEKSSDEKQQPSELDRKRKSSSGLEVLLPPSFVRVKNRYHCKPLYYEPPLEEEWDGENLTESQDAALDEYIRNPQEIKQIENVQKHNTKPTKPKGGGGV